MRSKLNAKSALLVVLLYLVLSIAASLLAAIFFGGISATEGQRNVDDLIDGGMYALMMVLVVLLYISFFVFKDSRKDIFFERKPFALSRRYYFFPLMSVAVSLFALFFVDYSSYVLREILLVVVAALLIGANEEIVTRGILLVGLRNSRVSEWKAWLLTVLVFSLLHLVNVLGGGNFTVLLVVVTGGTLWYVSRRVFNNLFISIGLHALYDTAFFLLTGPYLIGENLPDRVLDIQLGSFLVLLLASLLFPIFGRRLLRDDTTGWQQAPEQSGQVETVQST